MYWRESDYDPDCQITPKTACGVKLLCFETDLRYEIHKQPTTAEFSKAQMTTQILRFGLAWINGIL